MHQSLAPNRFTRVAGILNGTCNYILTEMERTGKAFQEVLGEAQKLGYAEPDPTFDIEGTDTAHKIAILASLSFGQDLRIGDVEVEGISRIKADYMRWAESEGLRIKLIATAREVSGDAVDVYVAPTLVPRGSELAVVDEAYNGILFEGEPIGKVLVRGRGAGQESTSSGVLSDVMAIAAGIERGGLGREEVLLWPQGVKNRIDPALSEGEFVLCLETSDAPGGMGGVVSALEKSGVGLRRLECRPVTETTEGIKGSGLLFWVETARARMGEVRGVLKDLSGAGVLRDQPQIFRIERG